MKQQIYSSIYFENNIFINNYLATLSKGQRVNGIND